MVRKSSQDDSPETHEESTARDLLEDEWQLVIFYSALLEDVVNADAKHRRIQIVPSHDDRGERPRAERSC